MKTNQRIRAEKALTGSKSKYSVSRRAFPGFFRVAALAVSLCLILSACGDETPGVRTLNSISSRNTITAPAEDVASVHYASGATAYNTPVAASGLIEMRVDEASKSFGIYESSSKTLWTALPLLEETGGNINMDCDAAMVTLKIIGGSDVYILNSQDNSLAYGTASLEKVKGGAVFDYKIFPNSATAERASNGQMMKDDIGFDVKVSVLLADGNMNVGCTYSSLTSNKDAYIEDITLLNYFGAYSDMAEGNFLFVPDGCGAIVKTEIYNESSEPLSFSVYGNDISNPSETSGSAIIPVFGIKRGNSAFATLIEKGDAVATINASKAVNRIEYNRVYPTFNLTPSAYENKTIYISKTRTLNKADNEQFEIKMCYRFLSEVNANYAGMASAIREQLIRNSVISTKTMEPTDYLPFFITLTGSTKRSIGKLKYNHVLTNFEQAEDMLIRIKSKGINNISLRYKAALSGGENSKDICNSRIQMRLGGSGGLSELYSYMQAQKMSLFIDIDMLSSSEEFSGGNSVSIFNKDVAYSPESTFKDSGRTVPLKDRYLRKWADLKNVIINILADFNGYDFTGFCLDDAGSVLYSDFSDKGYLRQAASETIAGIISPLSTNNEIMIAGGNFYMLKNINSVIELPLSTTVSKNGAYVPVPFVQLVLHGIIDYAGEPVNEEINPDETLLRCMEYGACPHYKWNYNPLEGTGENDIYYYENSINSAAAFYVRASKALNDLRDARMTDHYEVTDGVYCTEYDTGAMIFVNYTSVNHEVLGVTVGARDFLRVN
ncbi:MAG: hypothetical protein K6F64_06990 [Clostridia bacterium]|nr:hypothetical protein [Clostridia bacterium]